MIATTQRAWWPLAVPFAIILAMALVVGMTVSPLEPALFLVLAAQVVMAFLGFVHRPAWLLASLTVGQLTSANYMVPVGGLQVSTRLVWTMAAPVLLLPYVARFGLDLGPRARRLITPMVIFFALTLLSNAIYTDPGYTFKYFRYTAFWLVTVFLFPVLAREERDLKLWSVVVLIAGTISGVLAVMQHYSIWRAWDFMVSPITRSGFGNRAPGLAEAPPQLSWGLAPIIVVLIGVFFLSSIKGKKAWCMVASGLALSLGLYFTYTRTAPYALAAGGLAMGLFFAGRLRREFLLALLLVGAGFWWYTDMVGNRYDRTSFTEDRSGATRMVFWQAGLNIVKANPVLGMGHRDYESTSLEYEASISPYYLELFGAGNSLGTSAVHNDFLNVWLSFGTPALLLFLFLFGAVFWNFVEAYRRASSPFLKGLSLGGAGAVVTYAVNAFLHNIMDSSALFFVLAGLSLALTSLAWKTPEKG
ncbi:MAG: O-antigen ligase family protein [Chloroflexi bacterium]|nr:O-antigen ligase family protein [Chloroflexota bacterium]